MTSHAAVVARGMGKSCVTGARHAPGRRDTAQTFGGQHRAQAQRYDHPRRLDRAGAGRHRADDRTGDVGRVWRANGIGRRGRPSLGVRANADTPADARVAVKFGAEGIGFCRTEHMFFDEARIQAVREMILAGDEKSRREAIDKLLPMQRGDFVELFETMQGLPVTIRLLDPPLHEFLPHREDKIAAVAGNMGVDPKKLANRARELHEFNPMLGFRGCRIAIAYPELGDAGARDFRGRGRGRQAHRQAGGA